MVHIQSHLVVVVPENVRRWLWTEGLVLFIKVHCWSSYTLYDIYCTQFCLLKCIVGIIHCTTFTVPSSQYTCLLSRCPTFYFKTFSLWHLLLDTKHHVLCVTYNATIQKHKKSTQSKMIISHLWEITQVRLMVDPRSTCRSGEPWIRTCGTGGGKFQVFYLKVFVFFQIFFSQNATGSKQVELGRDNLWVLISFRFYLKDSFRP